MISGSEMPSLFNLTVSQFTGYFLIPRRDVLFKLNRVSPALDGSAKLAEGVKGHQPAMGVESDDVSEHSAEREGLCRLAQRVDERVVPLTARSDFPEDAVKVDVGFLKPCQHGCRRLPGLGRAVNGRHVRSLQRGKPHFFRKNDVLQK